jgi:hypothetical protein
MKENIVVFPPAWCGAICRNAMNDVCVSHCALKRDTSAFSIKPGLKLEDMPHFPLEETKGMTREERFTSVTIYLSKVVDHLKGVEDEHATFYIRRRHFNRKASSGVSAIVQIKSLLSSQPETDTALEAGEKREDQEVRPSEVAQPSD